jgi:hypothetical protein
MGKVPRRATLCSAATFIAAGCLSTPTENPESDTRPTTEHTEQNPTASATATGPVERGLEFRNEFQTEQTVSLKIVEYQSGFPEDGRDSNIESVTATPAADERVVRYDSELTIDADGRQAVSDVFTLADTPTEVLPLFSKRGRSRTGVHLHYQERGGIQLPVNNARWGAECPNRNTVMLYSHSDRTAVSHQLSW